MLEFEKELNTWEFDEPFKEFIRAWVNILQQGSSDDKKLLNYLMYMTQRLVRIKKIMKPSASIFLHCDPTASHYLKVIMDGIFGRQNFQNEVIWKRTSSHNNAKRFGPVHDVLLFYSRSKSFSWNRILQPHDEQYVEENYRYPDEQGRVYRTSDLTAPETRNGESGAPWRGYDPTIAGRHWAVLPGRSFPSWFMQPDGFANMTVQERLDVLDSQGMIYWPPRGKVPQYKRYLETLDGMPLQDVITDIRRQRQSNEYPTKKPELLLNRVIRAASYEGDIVFDPFCGCGTSIIAGHKLKRRWIGVDISGHAIDEIESSLAKLGVHRDIHYDVVEGHPDTMEEYNRLNPYEKQDWLIRRLNGLPNPRKSGDKGVDGDMGIHLGVDKDGRDKWGRVVFSVKTGKQRKPEHVRELRGTMDNEGASIGVLILDVEPTPKMEEAAQKAKHFKYQQRADLPPKEYDRIQILTAYEIVEGAKIDCPPTMQAVKRFREAQTEMKV